MSWAKLDDKFHSNPNRWIAGLEAFGLFAVAISYCADQLTDGFLPREWVLMQCPSTTRVRDCRNLVGKLLDAEMIVPVDGGWLIPDYLDYNPSRAQVLKTRAERAQAGRKGGLNRRTRNAHSASPEVHTPQTHTSDESSGFVESEQANCLAFASSRLHTLNEAATYPVPVPITKVGSTTGVSTVPPTDLSTKRMSEVA